MNNFLRSLLFIFFVAFSIQSYAAKFSTKCEIKNSKNTLLFTIEVDESGRVEYIDRFGKVYSPYHFGKTFDLAESFTPYYQIIELNWVDQNKSFGTLRHYTPPQGERNSFSKYVDINFVCPDEKFN